MDKQLFNADALNSSNNIIDTNYVPVTQNGDIWHLGDSILVCGDSRDRETYTAFKKDADLILTDPPYGVNYKNAAGKIYNDDVKELDNLLTSVFINCYNASTDRASIYAFGAGNTMEILLRSLREARFNNRYILSCVKNKATFGFANYKIKAEFCVFGWKKGHSHNFYGDKKQTTVIEFKSPNKALYHPTVKPLELIKRFAINSTKAGDVILDPFSGSGTTLIAADMLGCSCNAIELNERYCDVTVGRWLALHPAQRATLYRDGSFAGTSEHFGIEPIVC